MFRPALFRPLLLGPLLAAGCVAASPPVAPASWRFELTAVTEGAAVTTAPSPPPVTTSNVQAPLDRPQAPAPSPSPTPTPDLAEALAAAGLQSRIDALASLGPPAATDWQLQERALATELRRSLATLAPDDVATLEAAPAGAPVGVLLRLVPYGSPASTLFRIAADALASDIRERVVAGAAPPTGPGMQGLVFGGGYAPPVYGEGSGGGSGGEAPPPPPPTPGLGLDLAPSDGGFADPAATETAVVGP